MLSPQRVAQAQLHLHFVPSTRTISAEGRASTRANAISRLRHARSPQRVDFRGGLPGLPPALRENKEKRCEDVRRCEKMSDVRRCQMWEDVRRYQMPEDVGRYQMWEDVGRYQMWEDVSRYQMWEDVRRYQMWEDLWYVDLFTPPSFWRTLRSDALRKNAKNFWKNWSQLAFS